MVTIKIQPHQKRGRAKGGSTGPGSDGVLRLATNLGDVPAEIIALIYRYRWTILRDNALKRFVIPVLLEQATAAHRRESLFERSDAENDPVTPSL